MINYGDWQNMPDYREGWVDKHKNAFGDLLRAMDPMTYIPGVNVVANAVHDVGDEFVTGANRVLSPIVKGTNQVLEATTPGVKQLHEAVPMLGNINRFIEDKPFDAAALAAATFFSGGAAANAMGAAAAPAASGGAGAMGGMASAGAAGSAAITPSFMSGAAAGGGIGAGVAGSTTGALVGANAITPALASGTYGGIAGASGLGTLGTAGTAAGMSALTPAFASMGGAVSYGAMDTAKSFMNKAMEANRYRKNFSQFSGPDTDKLNADRQANAFAQKILESNSVPTINIKRIADKISMNRWERK